MPGTLGVGGVEGGWGRGSSGVKDATGQGQLWKFRWGLSSRLRLRVIYRLTGLLFLSFMEGTRLSFSALGLGDGRGGSQLALVVIFRGWQLAYSPPPQEGQWGGVPPCEMAPQCHPPEPAGSAELRAPPRGRLLRVRKWLSQRQGGRQGWPRTSPIPTLCPQGQWGPQTGLLFLTVSASAKSKAALVHIRGCRSLPRANQSLPALCQLLARTYSPLQNPVNQSQGLDGNPGLQLVSGPCPRQQPDRPSSAICSAFRGAGGEGGLRSWARLSLKQATWPGGSFFSLFFGGAVLKVWETCGHVPCTRGRRKARTFGVSWIVNAPREPLTVLCPCSLPREVYRSIRAGG